MKETTGNVVLYKAPDGSISLDVKLRDETIWLSLNQMAELFDRDKSVISRHLRNVFIEKELERKSVVAFFATTAAENIQIKNEKNLSAIVEFKRAMTNDFRGRRL
jgi:DNA ligase (NAD+)